MKEEGVDGSSLSGPHLPVMQRHQETLRLDPGPRYQAVGPQ